MCRGDRAGGRLVRVEEVEEVWSTDDASPYQQKNWERGSDASGFVLRFTYQQEYFLSEF